MLSRSCNVECARLAFTKLRRNAVSNSPQGGYQTAPVVRATQLPDPPSAAGGGALASRGGARCRHLVVGARPFSTGPSGGWRAPVQFSRQALTVSIRDQMVARATVGRSGGPTGTGDRADALLTHIHRCSHLTPTYGLNRFLCLLLAEYASLGERCWSNRSARW